MNRGGNYNNFGNRNNNMNGGGYGNNHNYGNFFQSNKNNYNNYEDQNINKQEDLDFFQTNKEIINEIKKCFNYLENAKIIEILKMNIQQGICTVFELLNSFHKENIIKMNASINASLYNFDPKINIFEVLEKELDNLHVEIVQNYKTKIIEDNVIDKLERYEGIKDRRRKIVRDVNGYFNYIPVMCDQHNEKTNNYDNLEECNRAHSENEINYHPLNYKTKMCLKKECHLKKLCYNSHGLITDFIKIYDVKDQKISCLATKIENKEVCKGLSKVLAPWQEFFEIPKKFSLESYKVSKCKLLNMCTDLDLCYNYHDEKEKRRAPQLFKLKNEVCQFVRPGVNSDFFPHLCHKKDHCEYIHTKYELLYHKENFRRLMKCPTNKIKGICKFAETCYGIHSEEKSIHVELFEKLDTFEKLLSCPSCLNIPDKYRYAATKKCLHTICLDCVIKSLSKNQKCPYPGCKSMIVKGEIMKINLGENLIANKLSNNLLD